MTKTIQRYHRNGSWSSSHIFHYECAWNAFYEYGEYLDILQAAESELKEKYKDEDPEIIAQLIHHNTDDLWDICYRASISAHLFGCMCFEGFLNFYGVKRLGELFYKRRMERLGITEKLSLLALACEGVLLEPDSPLLVRVRELFDRRNALMHPKTREINMSKLDDFVVKHPLDIPIATTMQLLEQILEDFCSLDSDVSRDFEFRKPNKQLKPTALNPEKP